MSALRAVMRMARGSPWATASCHEGDYTVLPYASW
jgi:hypothetical protein